MNSGSPSTPLSPYTLSTERYKANVNRTKTRKWVEAKKIDYGGDDWGADDNFDDDDEDDDDDANNDNDIDNDIGNAGSKGQPVPQPMSHPQQPSSRPDRLAGLRAIGDGSGSSTPRSGSAGSARSLRPSERIAMERQGSGGPQQQQQQRNVTAPPILHVHTGVQQQRPVPPAVEPQGPTSAAHSPFPPRKSSISQQEKSDLGVDPAASVQQQQQQQQPPRTSSRPTSPGVRSPASIVSPSGASRIIRPSEIYRRMEEEKDRERRSIDSARRSSIASSGDGDGPDTTGASARRPSFGNKPEAGDGSRNLQALAPVAERKSEYGFDGLMINPGAPPPQQSEVVSSDFATETARDTGPRQDPEASQETKKRYSTSPKLPDLTRISGFGSDFFSSGGGMLGGSPKRPEAAAPAEATPMPATDATLPGVTRIAEPTRHEGADRPATHTTDDQSAALVNTQPPPEPSQPKPFRPSLPGGWVSETPSSTGEMATPFENDSAAAQISKISPIGEHPEDLALKPAPLRTPTPRDRETFSKSTDDERASIRSRSGRSSPVKPLPLRTTPSPLARVEQQQQSGQTSNNIASNPEQHEDASQAQDATLEATPVAVAPLQPRKSGPDSPTPELPRPILRADTVMTDTSSPLKESDVLRDEIIQSLSPVRGSDTHLDAPGGDDAAIRESAYLSDVYGDYWAGGDKTEEHERARDAGHTEPLSSVTEGDSASATPTPPAAAAAAATTSELDPVKPDLRRERFSWEASSASPAPSPTKHPLPELPQDEPSSAFEAPSLVSPVDSGEMSPLIALPILNFDRGDGETAPREEQALGDASISSKLAQDNSNPDMPPSPTGDFTANKYVNQDSELLFSPGTEKMTIDSPTTPPTGEGGLTSLDPDPIRGADSPTDIPLPSSPSPTPPAGVGDTTTTIMNLKQIMTLPTSPERVYKMHEARGEFASTPSGLPQWLAQLVAQPEHANAAPSFKYAPAGDDLPLFANQRHRAATATAHHAAGSQGGSGDGVGLMTTGGAGRRSSVTLGASGLGGGGGGGGVRVGSMSGTTAAQLGNLMHGPAGAKGKELLQSAGKMGKGLLSKGKSKLRERTESKKG